MNKEVVPDRLLEDIAPLRPNLTESFTARVVACAREAWKG